MARVRAALGLATLAIGVLASGGVGAAESGDSSISGVYSARDERMQTRTRWDYQPGQGPKIHDRDYFYPGSPEKAAQAVAPTPPVNSGDWRNPPPAEDKLPKEMPSFEPRTEQGAVIGLQISNLHYHEAKQSEMKVEGPAFGLTAAYTGLIGSQFFLRGDMRLSGGYPEYKRANQSEDIPNGLLETRVTFGADFLRSHWGISPYIGLGYRFDRTNLKEGPNDGVSGYRRDSHYLFAPIGLEPRVALPNGARLSLTAEFDPLLQGWQRSYFSDVSATNPDISMRQKSGYGLHGELNYQTSRLSFGPFANYWNIEESETDCDVVVGGGSSICTFRPHNHTVEYGLNLRYHFH